MSPASPLGCMPGQSMDYPGKGLQLKNLHDVKCWSVLDRPINVVLSKLCVAVALQWYTLLQFAQTLEVKNLAQFLTFIFCPHPSMMYWDNQHVELSTTELVNWVHGLSIHSLGVVNYAHSLVIHALRLATSPC